MRKLGAYKPLLWPTLFTLLGVGLSASLGLWQLQRLQWKTNLIQQEQTAQTLAPLQGLENLPTPVPAGRCLQLQGQWQLQHQSLLLARTYKGQSGLWVITPFRTKAGVILVNQGWVAGIKAPAQPLPPISLKKGTITVVVRPPEIPSRWADPHPTQNIYLQPEKLLPGEPRLRTDCYGQLISPPSPGITPLPARRDVPNHHLEYALTWFSFSIILLAICAIYIRRHWSNSPAHGRVHR